MKKLLLFLIPILLLTSCKEEEEEPEAPKTYQFNIIYANSKNRVDNFDFTVVDGTQARNVSLGLEGVQYNKTMPKNKYRIYCYKIASSFAYPTSLVIYDSKRNKLAELIAGECVDVTCQEDGSLSCIPIYY